MQFANRELRDKSDFLVYRYSNVCMVGSLSTSASRLMELWSEEICSVEIPSQLSCPSL